jgi:hypothetical protein
VTGVTYSSNVGDEDYEATDDAAPDPLARTGVNSLTGVSIPVVTLPRRSRAYDEGEMPSNRALSRTDRPRRITLLNRA